MWVKSRPRQADHLPQTDQEQTLDNHWISTPSFDTLGRDRKLIANEDFSMLLVVDDNGGFEPTNEHVFQIIDSLIREIDRLWDRES